MSEKKMLQLTIDEIVKLFIDNGCDHSLEVVSGFDDFRKNKASVTKFKHTIRADDKEMKAALQAIVDKCNEAQSSIDSAKDQEIADLKRQLAAVQNDVKQLRQSRDKRNGETKQKTSETWFAPITSMDVRLVYETAGNPLTKDATDRLTGELMKKSPEIFGWPRNKSASIAAYPKGVWIDWHGGETAPIPDGVWHKVKLRCGTVSSEDRMASTWNWSHEIEDADIISFMIL